MSGNTGSMLHIQYNFDVVLCQLFKMVSISQWLNCQLHNYTMFYRPGTRKRHDHLRLVMYVHKQFIWKEITIHQECSMWDYLCILLSHSMLNSKKWCHLYRLPGGSVEEMNTFTEEFFQLLTTIKNNRQPTYICGDYTINLPQLHSNKSVVHVLNVSKGLFTRTHYQTVYYQFQEQHID